MKPTMPNFRDVSVASRQVATRSAMNPILWVTSICSPAAMVCSVWAPAPLNYLMFALAALPIGIASWGFVHFAKRDARRLQSEEHIEHMEIIARMGTNSADGGTEILIPAGTPNVNNPQISEGEGQ